MKALDRAALAAQNSPEDCICEDCGKSFPVLRMLAFLNANNEVATPSAIDNRMQRTMNGQHGGSAKDMNLGQRNDARLVCLYCCEKYHNTTYLTPAGKPTPAMAALGTALGNLRC